MQYRLIEAYGQLMFIQSSLTDRLNKLKAKPQFAEKLCVSLDLALKYCLTMSLSSDLP